SIYVASAPNGSFAINGLTDLVSLGDKDHFLAIERNFVAGQGNRITLYNISLDGATDIKDVTSLKKYEQPVQPVYKELIAHLNDFDIDIDNFEGIALGPALSDGGRLLLVISDNNFSSTQQ